jgi:hypothetical protein
MKAFRVLLLSLFFFLAGALQAQKPSTDAMPPLPRRACSKLNASM